MYRVQTEIKTANKIIRETDRGLTGEIVRHTGIKTWMMNSRIHVSIEV